MLSVLAHLGHPERFLNALANPSAMIAQEAYWSIPFGCLLLIDTLVLRIKKTDSAAIHVIGALLGLGLMVVTSIAYFTSYGVAGWPEIPTLFLFSVGDLALGAAFAIAFGRIASKPAGDEGETEDANRLIPRITLLLYAAFAITLIVEAIVFASLAVGPWGFAMSAAIVVVAGLLQANVLFGRPEVANRGWICFALIAAATIISRYAFYAMV